MSLKINADQQRIQASGATPTGNWVNSTYSRTVSGVVNILSVAHGFIGDEKLYLDFTSGGETDGTYTVSKVDDDNLSFQSSNLGVITAGNTVSYKRVRSLSIQGDESVELSVGVDANEKDALTLNLNPQNNIRVGVNTTDPQYELDVEGQIRTTRSIISDTAQVVNLDIQTIINPALALRAPNLINYEDTDVTSNTFGTTFYPTADTPPLTDQSRRVATTDFVYKVATNDTGGRVYVSQTIGSDLNDGRSAARPVKTIKKAAQIAYGLQKAQPDPSDEYVSLIVSGGEYLEDNPISLPRNCSLIGDNLRRVIVRPLNADRHMIKASNETYVAGCVFRDALQNSSDPQSTVIHTWKYAFVFDDKQRLYYEPELAQIPAIPGDKFRGDNIFLITFNNHTGSDITLQVGYFVQGGSSGTLGTIQEVNFTGPAGTPNASGTVKVLITSGVNDVFQDAEKIFYDAVANNIITDITNPSVSDRFDVVDAESLRPELETISNQIYQHTVNSERETTAFAADSTKVNLTTDRITITGHSFKSGDQVYYQKDENTNALGGLIDGTVYYVRFVDADTIELFDTWLNATTLTSTTGRKDITAVSPDTSLHLFTSGSIMPESNNMRIFTHQYATGDGVVYRASKMGAIGGLLDGTTYYIYKENNDWVRFAATAANALNKDANGNDAPTTLDLTGTGLGYQRFEDATRLLSIATLDTTLATQQTYNGPTFTLAGTSYHDYEVGQEVFLYGFQSSAINWGAGTNPSWSLSSGEVTVTIANVDNTLTTALFSNWQSLGECGLKFNFDGAGSEALSKTYLIDQFDLGSGTPSLPGNTELGMGYGRYNSSNLTVTFVLRTANIQSTTNTATASGSTVSVLDNVEDLNGRKYITHRIERADGYALQFVVRSAISVFDAQLNPTGNQSVISTNNYVLASLRNSPYGFVKISQTARFRDGAESIRANQEFIAQEAYGYVKSHYEKSSTRNSTLVIGPTTFSALGMEFDHPITSWAVSDDVATIKVNQGHNLYRGYKNHAHIYDGGTASNAITITAGSVQKNVTGATYDPVSGDLVLSIGAHTFTTSDTLVIANGSLSFTCSRDNHATSHTYPRSTDPAYGATLAITAVDAAGTVTVNVGTSAGVEIKGVAAFANGFSLNSTWPIKDIVDHRTFTLDLGVNSSGKNEAEGTTYTGTDGTFTDLRKPYRTPNSFPENNKQADAADLLAANAEMIAELSVEKMVADTGYSVPTGNTACTDDISDFLKKSLYHNLKWGGNDRVYDAANYFLKDVTTSNQSKYVTAFNNAKGYAAKVIRNLPILRHPHTTHPQQYETITLDRATYGTVPNLTQDAANLINTNNKFISEEAVERFVSSLTETPVTAVNGNDITINALNGTTPTNTTTHTFQGLSTYQFQPTGADYNPQTGEMVLTIASHPFVDGDRILIAPNSLTFTCEMDNDGSNKTYPRTTDPFYNKYLGVIKVDANNIKVNVGKAKTDVTPHTFVSAAANSVTRAVVYNDVGFTQHSVTNAAYEPITGVLTLTIPGHGFTVGEKVQVAQDSLTFTCSMDDNFSKHTYPRSTDPALNVWKSVSNITTDTFDINVGTTPPVTFTPTNAVYTPTTGLMEITVGNHSLAAPTSHTVTDATLENHSGIMTVTINDHGFQEGDKINLAVGSITMSCPHGGGGNESYPKAGQPIAGKWINIWGVTTNTFKFDCTGGVALTVDDVHTFVSAVSNGLQHVKENIKLTTGAITFKCDEDSQSTEHAYPRALVDSHTAIGGTNFNVTGASYNAVSGDMVLTVGNGHGLTTSDSVFVKPDSLSFNCTMDGNTSTKTYPRASDPYYGKSIPVKAVGSDTITLNVGQSPLVQHTVTDATYDPTTGIMVLDIGAHSLKANTSVKIANQSLSFQCNTDSYGSDHLYPRASGQGGATSDDPAYDTAVNITAVTATTITLDVGTASDTSTHRWKPGFTATNAITSGGDYIHTWQGGTSAGAITKGGTHYFPSSGIVHVETTASHGMRNGDWVKLADNSITFSCAFGGASGPAAQKSYPRSGDPISGKWQKIFNVTSTTFEIQVLSTIPSTNTDAHAFVSATTGGITQKRDKSHNTSVPIVATTGTTITVDVGISSNTTTHAYQSALGNSVITGGNYAHSFVSATSNGVKRSTSSTINNYIPSSSTYTPATGDLVLTIGSNELLAPTTHTASGGAYDPTTGIMTVTINGHGFAVGDKVKFDVGAISFSCTHGSGGTTAYPRSTDPIANKWVIISNVTTNTFDVQVLDTVPSTNTTTHTYQGAAADAISHARSTVKIATNSIIYSCAQGGGNYTYPRITDPIAAARFSIPNHNQDCKDDVSDVLRAVAYNLVNGGNDAVYDHAGYFVGTTHVDGEEFYARAVMEIASDITQQVIANETVNIRGWHGVGQSKDLTITVDPGGCTTPKSTVDTLFSIVEQAIATDSLAHATDTSATTPTCTDVVSAIDTFFGIITTALGTDGSYGDLSAVTRTFSPGDQQCLDDILHIVRALQYDLRYTGNSSIVESANKYISSGAIAHVTQEVDYTRAIFAYAKELCIKAIRNDLEPGFFSNIAPVSNSSITIDSSAPECANVVSALTTNWGILDNVLSSGTLYSGTITEPDPLITEQDAAKYKFPLLNLFLDLPVVEASPFIQNSSVISFLGGSGCDIDGAKVATPNVPRPGLKLDAQGNSIAQFDPQGKSMVANAFTIISFGGTAYNVTNDGYTQVVSVFAIFCQDGVVCQSGGYASITNSASNFGTYSLRATGFREDPYSFDIGVIDSITNDVDNNQVESGRQVIQVSGTTLTNIPTEDYIIRIGGCNPTDPAVEHIILETEVVSGAPGTQVVAKITTNRSMDYTDTAAPNTRNSYANGNLSNLVNRSIQFHRPSVVNSSSHTWEYSGSGNTYAALPQNGGFGLGTAYEASEQAFGQVYTSGTNEFGDFKVGNFVTIFNRTGAISFVGTVSISELSSIKIVGGDITITGFSDDDNLGGAFASDSLLPTQASVKDYISNNLGPYLNQPYSTNAVPSALVQLTSSGKINIDQIPALRPFNITSVTSQVERLAIEDANAGDIAIETTAVDFSVAPASVNTGTEEITITAHGANTGDGLTYTEGTTAIGGLSTATKYFVIKVDDNTVKLASTSSNATNGTNLDLTGQGTGTHTFTTDGTAISYILENDLESQFLAFTPNSNYSFTNGAILTGSSTTARGTVQSFNDGQIYNFVITDGGADYTGDFALTISAPGGSGTQATATANVTSGIVTKVTITNPGSGYYSQPTVTAPNSPTNNNAVLAAQIEGRVNINIANNIKFDAGDFILDGAGANEGTGTYSQSGTTITVDETGHNLSNASLVFLDFTSGQGADGFYTISLINANQYTVTSAASASTSGNFARKRIVDLTRVINTSASNAANWTQLTSTNIDASNIVAGTIDPERLASRGVSNSYTFLRGDSSWEYALQAIRPATQDCIVIDGSVTDSTYIDTITITNGGTSYTDGTYQNLPLEGGNVSVTDSGVARATYTVTSGVITSATVTDSGTGYTAGFSITIPAEFGGGNGAILTAVKGTINRVYGNIEIDMRKGDNLTPAATVYGNYGVFRFRKDVANQAVGNQSEGGFVIDNDGQVTIDQGPGSELNADKLDGNHGAFYQNAGSLNAGTLDPARLANTTYNISISGTADTANRVFNETASLTSNPSPAQAANGISAALRNNSATGLTDGGTTHGIMTYRREATGSAAIQIGYTDNDNLWIRGNSGGNTVYGNWSKIWSGANDGAASGLDADKLDGSQGLWYQSGYNFGNSKGGINTPMGDMFLPEVLGQDKMVFENFYLNDSGLKYTLYIPGFHASTGANGNINTSGTYTIYSDVGATNNIGSIVVDANGVSELTHTSGEIYSLVTGTIAFVGNNTNANIYVVGPNPGTKWTVTSSNPISSGSTTVIGLRDAAAGAKLQIGKGSVSTTPTVDFRSSGQAPDYDVQFYISGGNTNNGNGTLRINTGDITVNGNTVWHAGNDGSSSQLDAHYLDGFTQSTAANANTIARRDASGHLTVNDLTGDQGTFNNTGTGVLQLAGANGVDLGKAATNSLSIKGRNSGTVGYIRFGTDTNDFGWNGTHLSYNGVYFRNARLGVGQSNPGSPLHVTKDQDGLAAWATFESGAANDGRILLGTSGGSPSITWDDKDNDNAWVMGADDANVSYFVLKGFANPGAAATINAQATTGSCNLAIYQATGRWFINRAAGTGAGSRLNVGGAIETDNQLKSTVATGTAPLSVSSTTVCTNLNADLLDGYSALNLPYLQGVVNTWISDDGGQQRFYFANNSHTYIKTGDDFFFRNDSDQTFASWDQGGRCHFHEPGGNSIQSTYRVQVTGDSGLNLNASEGLSSGQKSTVLRAGGDKQWIDSHGVFKRNRNSVGESITVANGDCCMSAGPLTINNGSTVTIDNGGSWTIV